MISTSDKVTNDSINYSIEKGFHSIFNSHHKLSLSPEHDGCFPSCKNVQIGIIGTIVAQSAWTHLDRDPPTPTAIIHEFSASSIICLFSLFIKLAYAFHLFSINSCPLYFFSIFFW